MRGMRDLRTGVMRGRRDLGTGGMRGRRDLEAGGISRQEGSRGRRDLETGGMRDRRDAGQVRSGMISMSNLISEQIAHFLSKTEQMSDCAQKNE